MSFKQGTKQASYSVDWARATIVVDYATIPDVRNRLQDLFGEIEWRAAKLTPFSYNDGVECDYAGVYWNTEYPEFGLMLDMSGSRLSALRVAGMNDFAILEGVHQQGWKFTRIDVALDVYNSGARPMELYNAWLRGDMTTRARKALFIQGREAAGIAGETVNFGSRSSDVMLRVYDKAKEMKQEGDRIRVEFEVKREKANAIALSCLEQGIPRTLAALVTEQITAGVPEWIRAACDVEFDIVKVEASKDTNFERWFESTVLPAIEKAVRIGYPNLRKLIDDALRSGSEGHGK